MGRLLAVKVHFPFFENLAEFISLYLADQLVAMLHDKFELKLPYVLCDLYMYAPSQQSCLVVQLVSRM